MPQAEMDIIKNMIIETWMYDTITGKDAVGLDHSGMTNIRIYKVVNDKLRQRYLDYVKKANPIDTSAIGEPLLTQLASVDLARTDDTFDELSEVLLFHGSKTHNIDFILQQGLRADNSKNALYGKGIYFAESAQKADQYADISDSRRDRDLEMLIARVAVGRMVPLNSEDYSGSDSVIGGKGIDKKPKRFREIRINRNEQCFVQYVVKYDRKDQEVMYTF